MKTDYVGIHERILKARGLTPLTQVQAAALTGISRETLCQIETGRQEMKVRQLLKLAEAYQVDPCWILTGKGQAP